MSSLTNQSSSTKSLTGLSDTYSTNIICDTFEVSAQFTIDTGCIINIPANIIPDSALSTNVAFKNQSNTFTQTNTFNALTIQNATLRNFSSIQAVFPGDFRMLDSTQTYLTQMFQNGTTSIIDGNYASSRFLVNTRNASSVGLQNLIIENANHVVIQGTASEIDILGTAVSLNGICSFTNTTTPVITQPLLLTDNSTKISTTAFVKGQNYITTASLAGYAQLAANQTFTGANNFVTQATGNNTTLVATTAFVQAEGTLLITSIGTLLLNYALLNPVTQTFTGSNNFPTQLTTDNSTLVATTAYVKNQGYATTASLSAYALLTPSAVPQIFTGQQQFKSSLATLPVSIISTTGGIVGGGGLFTASAASQYNQVVQQNDLVLLGVGPGLGNANTKLCLTTYSNTPVGIHMDVNNMSFDGLIIRQNAPFNCGYSYIATPVTTKTNFDIGYVWTIPYASFTGGAFGTSGTGVVYNILTLPWNGGGSFSDTKLGVWKVNVVIMITCTSAGLTNLSWNNSNSVSMVVTDTCVVASDAAIFSGGVAIQILRMSFTINASNLTTTYFLNSSITGGAGKASNTTSNITFTRIA